MGEPGLYSGNRHRHIPLPSMGHYFRSSRGSRHWRTVGWQTHTRSSQSRAGRFCRISLGGNFKGIALRLFRGCLHFCSILISFLSFLRRKTKNFFFERYDDGSVDSSWGLSLYISTPPSLRATSPIFCVAKHRGGGLMPFCRIILASDMDCISLFPPLQFFIEDRGYSSGLLHSKLIRRTLLFSLPVFSNPSVTM